MSWDVHKPMDEQPDRFYRWAPWVTAALVILVVVLAITGVLS